MEHDVRINHDKNLFELGSDICRMIDELTTKARALGIIGEVQHGEA